MNQLTRFFKESHTSLGVFYPLHCLVAVFDELPHLAGLENQLQLAGIAADDIAIVEGKDFVTFEEQETRPVNSFMQRVSRFFTTEQISTDRNLQFAREGAVLVFVHCPGRADRERGWAILKQRDPIVAHYYDRVGVEHLAGSLCPTP
jgi:hypothetical protein